MGALRPVALLALGAALLLQALGLAAQDTGGSASSDDSLFGAETVTESKPADAAAPEAGFLKYDQVKVGGSITSSLGYSATWIDPWNKAPNLLSPDSKALQPAVQGIVKITAKPLSDFGVNMDFRSSWPFYTTKSFLTSATYSPGITTPIVVPAGVTTKSDSITTTNFNIFALYSKFSWKDRLYFSFGKQPLAWGVSKSFFQPADDIFALTPVDYGNLTAEREGPIAFKAQYPLPINMSNLFLYAGVPNSTTLDVSDLRLAAKAETTVGNTEIAAAGFYSYNDHPRFLVMGTTGTGDFNFFGEAIGKWGSERYFLSKTGSFVTGAQKADQAWFSGTAGAYYTNSDYNIIVSASYYYNGEGQTGVSAQDAFTYYYLHQDQIDRIKFGTHYAALSFSQSKIFVDNLSVMVYGLGDLSDGSFMLTPSLSWKFFDYLTMKLGGTFSFGPNGSEWVFASSPTSGKPSASLNLSFDLGSGAF
jgi:hypothetical protein